MSVFSGMPVEAWLDDDGKHVWLTHTCAEELVTSMLPWPTWHQGKDPLGGPVVEPSVACETCDMHIVGIPLDDGPSLDPSLTSAANAGQGGGS